MRMPFFKKKGRKKQVSAVPINCHKISNREQTVNAKSSCYTKHEKQEKCTPTLHTELEKKSKANTMC